MVESQKKFLKEITNFYWENGYNPEITQMERLAHFAQLVHDKNGELNLVSKKDINSIVENHVFISSYIYRFVPQKSTRFLDIGTGGGFPGIPLSIMRPDLKGVLVDATKKKINAVNEFIEKLMLINVKAENNRVESPEFIEQYKESFDLVVSRATVPLIILLRYTLPLVEKKAFLMAMKGGDLTEEFKKAETKYGPYIKKATTFELHYKPSNIKNIKGKKLLLLELNK